MSKRKINKEKRLAVDRRALLKGGAAAAGVTLLQGCRERELLLFEQPMERPGRPGVPIARRSVCQQCPAGCWTEVKVVDGDAKKLEGASGPINDGGLCALGQSSLQELYNPDRILQPLRRVGERGEGRFEEISWEEALVEWKRLYDATSVSASGRTIAAAIGAGAGPMSHLWRRFMAAIGAPPPSRVAPFDFEIEQLAARVALGFDGLPVYDIARSDYVVSFGAAFVDRWRSPVGHARQLSQLHTGRRGRRGKLVQVEARQSLTAVAADEWLPVRPGTEGMLARALAGVLIEGADAAAATRYRALFSAAPPSLDDAAQRCDVPLVVLERLAEELSSAEAPLVVVGGSAVTSPDGLGTAVAALGLDVLLGAVGRPGGVSAPSDFGMDVFLAPELPELASFSSLGSRLRGEWAEIDLLLVSEADPVHQAPAGWRVEERLEDPGDVGGIVALSSFLDDTTLFADLVLPIQTDIERFAAVEPVPAALTASMGLAEPAVQPEGEARHPGDVLLAMAATLDDLTLDLPWDSFRDVVVAALGANLASLPGGADARSAAAYLSTALSSGGIVAELPPGVGETADGAGSSSVAVDSRPDSLAADATSFPDPAVPRAETDEMTLLLFETVKAADGRAANRPWMQELPDPRSTVQWGSWAEISAHDARELGVHLGEIVRLTSAAGSIELPVFIDPALRPGCVAAPMGFGHRNFGRYARGRGANVLDLVSGDELVDGTAAPSLLASVTVERIGMPAYDEQVPIYGRGLYQHEEIPSGWAPQHASLRLDAEVSRRLVPLRREPRRRPPAERVASARQPDAPESVRTQLFQLDRETKKS